MENAELCSLLEDVQAGQEISNLRDKFLSICGKLSISKIEETVIHCFNYTSFNDRIYYELLTYLVPLKSEKIIAHLEDLSIASRNLFKIIHIIYMERIHDIPLKSVCDKVFKIHQSLDAYALLLIADEVCQFQPEFIRLFEDMIVNKKNAPAIFYFVDQINGSNKKRLLASLLQLKDQHYIKFFLDKFPEYKKFVIMG